MAAGSRDRPPMLATGRYHNQITVPYYTFDTRPNGEAIAEVHFTVLITQQFTTPAVPATEIPGIPCKTSVENNKSTPTADACHTAQEMWEAIQVTTSESLNISRMSRQNLFWEFGQFTSHDGETIESYYTRFYMIWNEMI
ncbi:hypothetical protein Tco_1502024 [Tanacetum coccineum]